MIVVPDRKALVLAMRNSATVTASIPTARTFQMHGREFVAVPHKIDETRVLRNLGLNAPSPILHHYNWPGLRQPFEAQRETAAFSTLHDRMYILNEIGTGKTLAVLWAIDYLKMVKASGPVLVVAPLSTVDMTWGDEIALNFPHLRYVVLHGTAQRRRKLLAQPADIYIINHDGVFVMQNELAAVKWGLVVIDELTQAARNAATRRWKSLNKLINDKNNPLPTWGLTGSPRPKGPMDVWAQAKLITKNTVPTYKNRWREMTMYQVTKFKWVERPEANTLIAAAMSPAIRFARDQCFDLPECMTSLRAVNMSDEQKRAFKLMQEKLKADIQGGQVVAVNDAVKLGKLLQIACGVVLDNQGEEVSIGAPGRIAELQEIIEQSEGKVIVYVPYVAAISYVQKSLEAAGYTVGVVYGEVSKTQRDAVFTEFKSNDAMRVLIAQPASMSHGLTLVQSNTIVWYAPIMSNDIFIQANGRITRPGQKRSQFIIMLSSSPVEQRRYKTLLDQGSAQGELLDALEASTFDLL